MNDETRTPRLMIWMLAWCFCLAPGCGGSGGSGGGGGSTDNTNLNDNSDKGNANGIDNANGDINENENNNADGDPLRAQIEGLPETGVEVGQQIQLSAAVTNDVGVLVEPLIQLRGLCNIVFSKNEKLVMAKSKSIAVPFPLMVILV